MSDDTPNPTPPEQAAVEAATSALAGIGQTLTAALASQQGALVELAEAKRLLEPLRCPRTQKPPLFSLNFERDADGEGTSTVVVQIHSKVHRRNIAEAAQREGLRLSIQDARPAPKRKKKRKKEETHPREKMKEGALTAFAVDL